MHIIIHTYTVATFTSGPFQATQNYENCYIYSSLREKDTLKIFFLDTYVM